MNSPPEPKFLYRYINYQSYNSSGLYSFDYDDHRGMRSAGMSTIIECIKFPILKETPKGFWIDTSMFWGGNPKRFVLNSGRRRFAHPTESAALESFIRRKKAEINILNTRLANAKAALAKSEWDKKRAIAKTIDKLRESYDDLPKKQQKAIDDAIGYKLKP